MGRNGHGPKLLWAEMSSDHDLTPPSVLCVTGGKAKKYFCLISNEIDELTHITCISLANRQTVQTQIRRI